MPADLGALHPRDRQGHRISGGRSQLDRPTRRQPSRIAKAVGDVLGLQLGELLDDLGRRLAGREMPQDDGHRDAKAAHTGEPLTSVRIRGNARQPPGHTARVRWAVQARNRAWTGVGTTEPACLAPTNAAPEPCVAARYPSGALSDRGADGDWTRTEAIAGVQAAVGRGTARRP